MGEFNVNQAQNSISYKFSLPFLILVTTVILLLPDCSAQVYEKGDIVDDFTLLNEMGDPVSLSDYDSWAVLLSFWNAG